MTNLLEKKTFFFIILFTILGLGSLQVPFTQLAGSKATFTLFDFFGPIATGFIGVVPGIVAVFSMQFLNFLIHGTEVVDAGTIIRFFPMLFAAWYFSQKSRWNIIIPLLAIGIFIIHPVGRLVWYYSLYWLIPIAAYFWRDQTVFARSFGATFTAHAVGGALWVWAFNLPQEVWISLIPVVFVERILFAFGIAAMYVIFTNVLAVLEEKRLIPAGFYIDRRYLWKWAYHHAH